jgi:membrane-anchored protein YejM (alkaline phosphatase superfamily)
MKKSLNWFWSFFALNSVISFLISILYLSTPSTRPDSAAAALFTVPYFWAHLGLLMIFLYSPFFILTLLFPRTRFLKWLFCLYIAFIHTVLLVDTFVYQQYRFHINLFVLDLFFNGQGQVISFSWYLWAIVIAFMAGLWAFELWLSQTLEVFSKQENLKLTRRVLGVWFICLLGSHLSHAIADAYFYRPITKMGTIPPFPAPFNAQETFAKYGLIDVEAQKNKSLMSLDDEEKSLVHYPLEELRCKTPERLNVLFILLDSTRYDALNETVMPNAYELSKRSIIFNQHFSGSNSTRGGVFSFFYGLPPLYFDKFKDTHTSPVLMDQFLKNHYQTKILGSAPLTKPEFDRTVFSKIENLRKKSKAFPAFERDREITDEWLEFTEKRQPKDPFFGFLFYDSAHEFSYDPAHIQFKPFLEEINYFALNNSTDPTLFLNRYKNSVYYIDQQLGRIFDDLKKRGLLDNTVIVFSSDHGKEFNDNKLNYWGHNSNFTDAQTHVPFFIYWPESKKMNFPKTVDHWTTHYDLAPTLMEEIFHCENKAEAYSSGENLMTGLGHKWLLHGTYGDFGIRLKDHFIVIKTAGSYEVLDLHYRPVDNIQVDYDVYNQALKEMRRFYK